jgi:hypothetical protein
MELNVLDGKLIGVSAVSVAARCALRRESRVFGEGLVGGGAMVRLRCTLAAANDASLDGVTAVRRCTSCGIAWMAIR